MSTPEYCFDLFSESTRDPIADPTVLARRPLAQKTRSLQRDASRFVPGEALATAIKTSICIGEPLLITGEPGTGKTQAAYYAAWKLGLGADNVLHFQVKSDSTAKDLLYHFDTVRYFQDANLGGIPVGDSADQTAAACKARKKYRERRELWIAFRRAKKHGVPSVLLIDEIDKAPRDFPNDLLHELDQMEIRCRETRERVRVPAELRPLVFITSNSERRLPEPFLRRCVYHHIRFSHELLNEIVQARLDEFSNLSPGFRNLAIDRFLALRASGLIKQPSSSELLVWLRVVSIAVGLDAKKLEEAHRNLDQARTDPSKFPYLGVLLKNRQDLPGES